MASSPAIAAARHFLSVAEDGPAPSDIVLMAALDRLVAVYHDTPDDGPSEDDRDPPSEDGAELYQRFASRFPDYGYYAVADPTAALESAAMVGDAIDDLADITRDMREVIWLAEHKGINDANWSFRLLFFHWGRHAKELSLYLQARESG